MSKRLLFLAVTAALLAACGHKTDVTTTSSVSTVASPPSGPVMAPPGSNFYGKLSTALGSKTSKAGDAFQIAQHDTLMHKNPGLQGAIVDGHVVAVTAAGPMKDPSMQLAFDDIRLADGTKESVDVTLVSTKPFAPTSHHLRTIGMMVGGAMAAKHLAHGHSMLGAAGGYAASQALKTDIDVKAGTELVLRFNAPVTRAASPQ